MKFIPNVVSSKFARQMLVGQKHSPTILFVSGTVGVVASAVWACKSTLKLEEVLEEGHLKREQAKELHAQNHPNYSARDYKKDMTYIYVRNVAALTKLYGPPVALGVASIAALTGSHNILSRRNVALTAAYSAVEKGFKQYRERVVEEFGEDKDREFRYGVQTRELAEDTEKGVVVRNVKTVADGVPSMYARFFDEVSVNWSRNPEYNNLFLRCQQNYANDLLKSRGHVFLNEVYDMLGLERTKAGAVVGWVMSCEGSDNFIDFGVFDGNSAKARDFVNGRERSILLDFNVDGVILDKI